jgi:hypothetical protein
MIGDVLRQASFVAVMSMFVGIVPLGVSVVYAIWPSEERLTLMRPLSLATIFAAISGTVLGVLNVFYGVALSDQEFSRVIAGGIAKSLVPIFLGFGCLTVAWLCVALGLWRRS